jgi:hypothetical protein
MITGMYKNKKTGNLYGVLGEAINSTNAQNGQIMVSYFTLDENVEYKIFVREKNEFLEKFTAVK